VSLPLSPSFLLAVAALVAVAGAVNGIAGFGFAVVGTMALATAVDPSTAVVFMLLPILAVNVSLARDLSTDDLRSCGRRFAPLLAATVAGTVVGMTLLDRLPEGPVRLGLGFVTLAFVASRQRAVPLPDVTAGIDRSVAEGRSAMTVVGLVSGVLFGATNVGIQLVAYVRRFDLSHGLFVGVVALVFLGVNTVRVGIAGALGLYPDATVAGLSLAATIPAAAGVAVGSRLRPRVSERLRRTLVLGLLSVIGVRLVVGGLGVA
jgi:uncharacterized membrane protein YfcA